MRRARSSKVAGPEAQAMAIASEQAVPAICPRGPLRLPPTSGSRPTEAQLGVTVRAAPGLGPRARAGLQVCRLRRLAESAANAQRHSAATLRRKKLKPRCQLFRGLQLAVASLCPCGELKQKSIFQHRRTLKDALIGAVCRQRPSHGRVSFDRFCLALDVRQQQQVHNAAAEGQVVHRRPTDDVNRLKSLPIFARAKLRESCVQARGQDHRVGESQSRFDSRMRLPREDHVQPAGKRALRFRHTEPSPRPHHNSVFAGLHPRGP
mmetsp:Transcript_4155/g.17514  ORF Transcript_4155/g.17514 Transcript_4155/m.17514 type:complete len:264 (-) Transcript_4155:178-969(-)